MKEREAPGASGDGVVHRRLGGAVAPAHLVRVLIEAVLRVVDDDVGAGEELDVTAILAVHGWRRSRPGRGRDGSDEPGCVGLVIDRVDHRDRAHLEPIAQGQRGMIQVLGDHTHAADGEAALGEVVVADRGPELPERDGEIRVLHLPRQRPFQLVPQVTRGIDVPFVVGVEQGREEGKALDVVPVRVGDHQVPTHGAPVRGQRQPESVGAGAAVEDDQGAVRRAHLDARRVTPVAERGRTRHRQRPTGAPEPDQHRRPPGSALRPVTLAHPPGESNLGFAIAEASPAAVREIVGPTGRGRLHRIHVRDFVAR